MSAWMLEWAVSRGLAGPRRMLALLGAVTRRQTRFSLMLIAASWSVLREAVRPNTWRRTVRYEFRHMLTQAIGGGLYSTLFTAALTGFGIVTQAVYWLGIAGMAQLTGSLMVTVLVREIAPVLVGVILLGRSGMLMLTRVSRLTLGGQMRTLQAQGIDPFITLALPRTLAMMVAGFALGMIFGTTALLAGYAVCRVQGVINGSIWTFFNDVVDAMRPLDYVVVPAKCVLSGFFVGLCACLTGLDATREDDLGTLLPRGFVRGILAVMVVNTVLSVSFSS
nr:ABC transporter permease [Tanticharoenia sakaeratensis]